MQHYRDVIMSVTVSRITGISIVCSAVCSGTDQRNIDALCHWPLWGESTGHRWIPLTKGSNTENVSNLRMPSWVWGPALRVEVWSWAMWGGQPFIGGHVKGQNMVNRMGTCMLAWGRLLHSLRWWHQDCHWCGVDYYTVSDGDIRTVTGVG